LECPQACSSLDDNLKTRPGQPVNDVRDERYPVLDGVSLLDDYDLHHCGRYQRGNGSRW
jgi:hypothetical protein